MALIVKKFGGTSLATPSHIIHLASKIGEEIKHGNRIVIIVSAMDKTTDELMTMAKQISQNPNKRELDMLLTAGERISMSLFSMALNSIGIKSYSFTGSQIGIITTSEHTNAKIISVKGERLIDTLKKNVVPIIAGYQGVSNEKEITTLGRGGSDTTAVTIAAFLNADICEIYTDVDGIFTVDPQILPSAKPIKNISYKEMFEMASLGSQVLHPRSVEIAMKHNIKLFVKSSFNEGDGTMIEHIETSDITGISYRDNLTLINIKTKTNIVNLLKNISDTHLNFYHFIHKSNNNISFITETENVNGILSSIDDIAESININNDIGTVSVIGNNISDNMEIINNIIGTIDKYKDDIFAISNSTLSITIVIKNVYINKIVKELSLLFDLSNDEVK